MKLSTAQKASRQQFMEDLDLSGGIIRSEKPSGDVPGFTVAVMPASEGLADDAEFFFVAVSTTDCGEKFSRKRGELVALERLFGGEFITVPSMGRSMEELAWGTMALMVGGGW